MGNFFAQNRNPQLGPRAYVLVEVGAVIRKRVSEGIKREIATQRELMTAQKGTQIMGRARLCLSLQLATSLRKFTWRNCANCARQAAQNLAFARRLQRAQGCHVESKVGPESGAHFYYMCWAHIRPCICAKNAKYANVQKFTEHPTTTGFPHFETRHFITQV